MIEGSERRDPGQDAAKAEQSTRPQKGGEAATTRFGMENGDNTDVAATGGVSQDEEPAERSL